MMASRALHGPENRGPARPVGGQARPGPARLQIGNPGPARPVGNVAAPYEKQLQVRYFHSFGSPKTYLLDLETGDFPRISGPARLKTVISRPGPARGPPGPCRPLVRIDGGEMSLN